MATATGLMTIAEFESLSDDAARNKELVDGELVEMPGTLGEHDLLRDFLFVAMTPAARRVGGHVTTDVLFDFDGEGRAPDLAFLGPAKLARWERRRRIQPFVPDLLIEIAGEYDPFQALNAKAKRYIKAGTPEAWLISIQSRELFRLTARGTTVHGDEEEVSTDVLPGFHFRLGDLLDRLEK